jgi:RNA polymerase sigma-70 factor (TIGR02943 family)
MPQPTEESSGERPQRPPSPEPQPTFQLDPTTWVHTYSDALYSYAMAKLRDSDAAEEAVQETFVAALKNRAQFRQEGTEGAWLMGILKRKVFDHLRRLARRETNFDGDEATLDRFFDQRGHWKPEFAKQSAFSLDSLELAEFRDIFQKCVGHLPKTQASAFVMREVEQKNSDEVCQTLSISVNNLWVLMHRARLRLAACIRQHWGMGDH